MYEQIEYRVEEPIATVTLNRPERLNAWTDRMAIEVRHAFAQAEADERVVAMILTGAGRGFCAGADLQGLSALSQGQQSASADVGELAADPGDPDMDEGYRAAFTYLASLRKPVIGAINGPCAGMGLPFALSCDVRFASERALFTVAFPQRGLIAEWGVAWLLPRAVGTAHAMDMILSGRRVDAREAERMGLVNRVLPHDDLMKHAVEYARLLAEKCSPRSMAVAKRQVWEGLQEPLGISHQKAVRLMNESLVRPDFKEGVQSFVEGRPPRFERVKAES